LNLGSGPSASTAASVYPCGRTRPGWCPQSRWDLPPDFEWEPCHLSLVWTRPKTAAGERPVPIIAPLLAKLRVLYAADTGPNPHNLVWHHNDGRPMGPREDYKAWKSLLQDAGIISGEQTLSLHVARHTAATMLRAAGVDEQTRMEILGHASVDAQRIYAHADRTRHLEAMSPLAALMAPPAELL
jgi:integrase